MEYHDFNKSYMFNMVYIIAVMKRFVNVYLLHYRKNIHTCIYKKTGKA